HCATIPSGTRLWFAFTRSEFRNDEFDEGSDSNRMRARDAHDGTGARFGAGCEGHRGARENAGGAWRDGHRAAEDAERRSLDAAERRTDADVERRRDVARDARQVRAERDVARADEHDD